MVNRASVYCKQGVCAWSTGTYVWSIGCACMVGMFCARMQNRVFMCGEYSVYVCSIAFVCMVNRVCMYAA